MTSPSPASLIDQVTRSLQQQREALIARDVVRMRRAGEMLAEALAALGSVRVSDPKTALHLRQIQAQVRLNRRLTENGLAVADHFAASLGLSANTTSVLLHERA